MTAKYCSRPQFLKMDEKNQSFLFPTFHFSFTNYWTKEYDFLSNPFPFCSLPIFNTKHRSTKTCNYPAREREKDTWASGFPKLHLALLVVPFRPNGDEDKVIPLADNVIHRPLQCFPATRREINSHTHPSLSFHLSLSKSISCNLLSLSLCVQIDQRLWCRARKKAMKERILILQRIFIERELVI